MPLWRHRRSTGPSAGAVRHAGPSDLYRFLSCRFQTHLIPVPGKPAAASPKIAANEATICSTTTSWPGSDRVLGEANQRICRVAGKQGACPYPQLHRYVRTDSCLAIATGWTLHHSRKPPKHRWNAPCAASPMLPRHRGQAEEAKNGPEGPSQLNDIDKNWSGRRDSNPRPQPWQGCALPLSYARSGAMCRQLREPPAG